MRMFLVYADHAAGPRGITTFIVGAARRLAPRRSWTSSACGSGTCELSRGLRAGTQHRRGENAGVRVLRRA
jgi:hypothetical protein